MPTSWSEGLGWPIVDDGLLMAAVGEVMFVHTDPRITEPAFERHLTELARAIDRRAEGTKIGVVYDCSEGVDVDAQRRKRSAEVLDARRERLRRTTAAFALVTTSPVMRGILRAVFWLAPPPYPWVVVPSLREALAFVKTHLPALDVETSLVGYERLKARHAQSARSARTGS